MENKRGAVVCKKERKALKELNLCDDFLFDVVTEDLNSCKDILEMILGWDIKEIRHKEGQKVVHNLPGKRGIRMDFFVEDAEGQIFNVEMQKENRGNIPKRTRYYQALVDSPMLRSGARGFDELKPIYIIVICDFDLYGRGLYEYDFSSMCKQIPELEMGDDSHKIILNTKGTNKAEATPTLIEFLKYVSDSSEGNVHPDSDERLKDLHRRISAIKNSAKMEVSYMTMEERDEMIRDEGYEIGMERGCKETLIGQICRKLKKGKTAEQIADELEEELETVVSICKAAKAFAPEYDREKIYYALYEEE